MVHEWSQVDTRMVDQWLRFGSMVVETNEKTNNVYPYRPFNESFTFSQKYTHGFLLNLMCESDSSLVVYQMVPYLVVPHGPLIVSPMIPLWFPL